VSCRVGGALEYRSFRGRAPRADERRGKETPLPAVPRRHPASPEGLASRDSTSDRNARTDPAGYTSINTPAETQANRDTGAYSEAQANGDARTHSEAQANGDARAHSEAKAHGDARADPEAYVKTCLRRDA